MKKGILLISFIMCSMIFFGTSYAQVHLDVNAGYQMPTGDFDDSSKPGYGIGADVFAGLPLLPIQVGGRIAYNYFEAEDTFDDGNTSIIEILPSIRYFIAPPLSPVKFFGHLGAGLYNWKSEFNVGRFTSKDDGSDFGICVGAGLQGKLGPLVGVMVMPLYHIIMTEDTNTTYLSLNVGVIF